MLEILRVAKHIFDLLAAILISYASLAYSKKVREKYKILRLPDGNKHIIWILVVVLLSVRTGFDYYTDKIDRMDSATKKDIRQGVRDIQQDSREQWNEALSEIKKAKWPLDGDWNPDNYDLMDQKMRVVIITDQSTWYPDGGNYDSYQELWDLKHGNNPLQPFIEDQLRRVNSVLRLANSAVRRIPLCKNNRNIGNRCLEVETEADFDVNNVVAQMSHPLYWVSRAKSAYLLHFLTFEMMEKSGVSWKAVLEALYAAFAGTNEIHKDNNVLVRYMAWESFREHTCFADEKELFDVQKTIAWWKSEENRQKVLSALESGRRSPFCE